MPQKSITALVWLLIPHPAPFEIYGQKCISSGHFFFHKYQLPKYKNKPKRIKVNRKEWAQRLKTFDMDGVPDI